MSRRRGVCVIVTVCALVGAGCGTKESVVVARAAAAKAEAAAKVSPEDGPGVTADTVKVGFVQLDTERLAKALQLDFGDVGDVPKQIQAMVDAANARGGIAGRKIVPVIRVYDAFTDNAPKEEALCKAFTQDDKVFAVVLVGQFQANARPCYAQAETLMLDTTQFPLDQQAIEELAPYLWQPSYPEYGDVLAGLVAALAEAKFFDDARLAVVAIDNPQNKRIYAERVEPALKKVGVEPFDVRWIDPASSATLQAGQEQAVLSFKSKGVNRLMVVGGSRLASFMMDTAKKQDFRPRFALTAWDNPEFNLKNYPEAVEGSVGISIQPGFEAIPASELAFPQPFERPCVDIVTKADKAPENRSAVRQALLYCDAVDLLRQAFEGWDGPINAEAFRNGAQALGEKFVSTATYASGFSPGEYTGGRGYRRMRHDTSCSCMRLDGPVTRFESARA